MVSIAVGPDSDIKIVGHGIKVEREFTIAPGITISPIAPVEEESFGSRTIGELRNKLNIMAMEGLADFSLVVEDTRGGEHLAAKAWNALWVFHLLSLACSRPVMSLYSFASTRSPQYMLANRNIVIRPLPSTGQVSTSELEWAHDFYEQFNHLIGEARFAGAMRAYSNAHYLFDDDTKTMLLWAGIEGLLGIEAELRQRIALHAAILHDGSIEEKHLYFGKIKKAYGLRSKVVHGAKTSADALGDGVQLSAEVLLGLLRKMVTLNRIPAASELDNLAASASLQL